MTGQNNATGIELAVSSSAPEGKGTQATLAEQLGVSQQAVSIWVRRGWVPLSRSKEIENLTGVPRTRLMNPRVRDLVDTGIAA